MENLDSLSVCSEVSDNLPLSNNTSLSGLSLYKHEFNEFCSTPKHDEGYISYDQNMFNPSIIEDIEKTVRDKYKVDVEHIRKNVELQCSDKIEQLLRANVRLQQQLENANMQIKRFIGNTDLNSQCHELLVQKNCLEKEISELKRDNRSLQFENKHLATDLENFCVTNDSHNICINKLKEKITCQQIEIQNLFTNNNALTNQLKELNISLEHFKKSNEWYKNQLHEIQNEKKDINKTLIEHKHKIQMQNDEISVLKIKLDECKNNCDKIKLDALKQKETVLKSFQNSEIKNIITNKNQNNCYYNAELISFQFKVIDLSEQLDKVKSNLSLTSDNYQQLSKNHSELLSKYIVLQKTLEQSQATIDQQHEENKEINKKVNDLLELEQNKNNEISKLRHNINILETKVRSHKHEREMVESSIAIIRNQFAKFKNDYHRVKNEMIANEKQILQLENEKQTLFMEKNWAICKSENVAKCNKIIEDLKKDIVVYENKIKELHKLTDNLENKIESNNEEYKMKLDYLEAYNNNNTSIISDLKKDIVGYKQEIKLLNEQLEDNKTHYKKELEVVNTQHKINISNLEKRCEELTKQNNELTVQLNFKMSQIETMEKQKTNIDLSTITKLFENGCVLNKCTLISKNILTDTVCNEIDTFENKLNHKLSDLNERLNSVAQKFQSFQQLSKNDTIQELKVALQVKDMELKVKEQKFNTNCHTLLRKVKEQMRSRNVTEKQLQQLQEINNTLVKDNTCMKINLSSKTDELQGVNQLLKSFGNVNTKLKETVIELETKYSSTCLERDRLTEKLTTVEGELERKCQLNDELQKEAIKHEEIAQIRNTEIHDLKDLNQRYIKELKSNIEELCCLENEIQQLKLTIENQAINARDLEEHNLNLTSKLETLSEDISQKELDSQQYQNRIDFLLLDLQSKQEEIIAINNTTKNLEDDYIRKQLDYDKRIKNLQDNLEDLQRELILQTNEKFFLQRLCKDLKLALNSHKNQNKVLNEKLSKFDIESNSFRSLPIVLLPNPPISNNVDNCFVNDLLEKHRRLCVEGKLADEVELQLDNLRKEISLLQNEISRKNLCNNKLATITSK